MPPGLHFQRSPGFRSLATLLAVALPLAGLLATATPAFGPQKTSERSLLDSADEVLAQMSRLTGLAIREPLKKQMVRRDEVRKILVEKLHTEFTPRELHAEDAALKAFGFVPREFSLGDFLVSFYTEQAAGFYDPRLKTMFIADWPDPDMQRMVLAHELTHALQDQNFGLERFLRAQKENDDATAAREAVAEGHAMAAMMQELIEPQDLAEAPSLEPMMSGLVHAQMEEFPVFSRAPYFFRVSTLFPYSEGMGFMQKGLKLGGWKRLNEIFARPPGTTKEFYDPELYFDSRPPAEIKLPPPAALNGAPGLRLLEENTLGELGYRALLGQFISEEEAKTVGGEWEADRYVLYESAGSERYAIVARTRWSSADSAAAFFRDYRSILGRKYGDLAPDARSNLDTFIGRAAGGAVILLRSGQECRWAEGVPVSQADALLDWLRAL